MGSSYNSAQDWGGKGMSETPLKEDFFSVFQTPNPHRGGIEHPPKPRQQTRCWLGQPKAPRGGPLGPPPPLRSTYQIFWFLGPILKCFCWKPIHMERFFSIFVGFPPQFLGFFIQIQIYTNTWGKKVSFKNPFYVDVLLSDFFEIFGENPKFKKPQQKTPPKISF